MVQLRRYCSPAAPALALLFASACGGGGSDDSTGDTPSTTQTPSTDPGTTQSSVPGTDTGEPTTGDQSSTPSSPSQAATSEDDTGPGTTPGTVPGTATSDGTTLDPPGTDTSASDGTDTGTATTDGTGGFDPADIPEIPDDGMPSSAHHVKVPLGTSDALQGYWEYKPPGYGGGELYPLMVFLHGIGENGNGVEDLDNVANNGVPAIIKYDQWPTDRPFVVLSPQHPGGGCPGAAEVHDFIAYALTHYDINPARVYLTGLSCGAIGAWGYLGEHLDEQITAMVPIAGDGNGAFNQAGCELGRVPIWAFHGDNDGTVNFGGTTGPISNLMMCDPKPDAEMVIYPGVGHDSWSMTYDLSAGHDIYAWFLARYKQP
jgi:pimeloyl-ACP methyl ester carboxylesterase